MRRFLPLVVALILRLIVAVTTSGASFDIVSYHLQAQSVFVHQSIYTFTIRYPYPPVWVWIVALAQLLSHPIPFVWLVKLPSIAAGCLVVILLQRYKGTGAALFYAVNPVAILITAGHGQFDGLVMACVVVAWVCWKRQQFWFAALALGLGIALKVYPVLLLPALILHIPAPKRLQTALAAFVPLLLSMLIYGLIFGFNAAMVTHVIGYGSTPLFGWSAYAGFILPTVGGAARAAVLLLPLVILWRRPYWPMETLWLATILGFYIISPGISVQYLLWVLPLFALAGQVSLGWVYTVFALLTAMSYYLTSPPLAVAVPAGRPIESLASPVLWGTAYLLTNALWWVTCIMLWRLTPPTVIRKRFVS